jgi:hypothetical protein
MSNEKTRDVRSAERYRMDGVARHALRGAGIDYTGDRIDRTGVLVPDSPVEAAIRMAEHIKIANPEGIKLLQQAGIEVNND